MDYTKLKGCYPGGDPVGLKGPDGMNTLSSYQAGKDDMITIIKAEIERLKVDYLNRSYTFVPTAMQQLLDFIGTLESEKPINPADAMKEIEEKIALVKQRGTWDGVDVDKYMDEVRGREPENPVPNDLEEASDEMAIRAFPEKKSYSTVIDRVVDYNAVDRKNYRDGIIAGAKWQAEQLLKSSPIPEDTVLFNKGVEEGKRLMMEDAVKWLVDDDYDELTDKGRFILGSVGIGYNGYYIPYSDLLKLQKEDKL